jgi:hypothetical protein
MIEEAAQGRSWRSQANPGRSRDGRLRHLILDEINQMRDGVLAPAAFNWAWDCFSNLAEIEKEPGL